MIRTMKRQLIIACLLFISILAKASKADPTPVVVLQPDGTKLTIVLHGDEHFGWIATIDGVLLVQQRDGYYVAKVSAEGDLLATKQLAHDSRQRSLAERKIIKAQSQKEFLKAAGVKRAQAMRRIGIGSTTPPYFPHMGSPKVLAILVEFSDSTFSLTNPKRSFDDYLNYEGHPLPNYDANEQRNYGSVRQYFKDMSNGLFTPQFDVVGPVKLGKTLSYYGADSGGSKDVNSRELIIDACKAVDGEVNFKDYDGNGDGIADLVYIIYAGYAQSVGGNQTTDLWPKSSYFYDGVSFDGVKIGRYGISNELNYNRTRKFDTPPAKRINGIGLFCHEFSHTMGLPDFYPVLPDGFANNQTMEFWDIMDSGTYTDNGYMPTPYTPWEKEVMGWIKVDTLAADSVKVELPVGASYKILTDNEKEYLIIHNVQREGWNAKQLGHGMLIYRVNYEKQAVNMTDRVNDVAGSPGMTIVPADGLIINSTTKDADEKANYIKSHAGDPFPGSENVDSLITAKLNYGDFTKPFYAIKEDAKTGSVSFNFLKKNVTTAIVEIKQSGTLTSPDTDHRIYTVDGRYVGTEIEKLPKGIYIQNKKCVRR